MILFYTGFEVMDARTLDERWLRNHEAAQKRLALKERAIAFLGGKCQGCGYDRCPAAFDFHHVDAQEKDFEISSRMAWTPALEEELRKCVLLCSNCHREAHAGWRSEFIQLEEEGGGGGYYNDLDDLCWDDEDTDVRPSAFID